MFVTGSAASAVDQQASLGSDGRRPTREEEQNFLNACQPVAPAASLPPGVAAPTDWTAAPPPDSGVPGKDPFNVVVIFANKKANMKELEAGLQNLKSPAGPNLLDVGPPWAPNCWNVISGNDRAQWAPVGTGNNPLGVLTETQGTGAEEADVQPPCQGSEAEQQLNMRLGGYDTELSPHVNHFRGYEQTSTGAWFLAASRETFSGKYHSIDPDGFDQGAKDLATDIMSAAKNEGWTHTTETTVTTQPKGGVGSNDVRYSGKTIFITVS
jgi:hypothetical protein